MDRPTTNELHKLWENATPSTKGDELDNFDIVCKKCGCLATYETESGHSCEICSSGGSVSIKCQCGEEETIYA